MTTENCEDDELPPPPPDYPALFRQYVVRSVTATRSAMAARPGALTDELRDQALHVLSFALKLAEAWPATRELLLLLAPKMEQAGYRDDWIPYLERGVALSQAQDDRRAEGELCLYLGELLRLRSKFELARQWLNTSIATFTALGENQGQARALNQLAYVAWQQHHYQEAEELAQTALTLLDEADPERATCFSRLGLVAIDRQLWEEAERYHRDALQIRQAQGDQRKSSWSLQNLGIVLRSQRKYVDATDCYQQAIAILGDIQDSANCAIAQMNLGIVYWLAGQPTKALEMHTSAECILGKLHDMHNLAAVLNNKGLSYLALQDWTQAERTFLSAISLFQQINDINSRLNALDGLGLVYLGQNKYDKAGAIFQSALDELQQIAGTPMYDYLVTVLPSHLAQARESDRS